MRRSPLVLVRSLLLAATIVAFAAAPALGGLQCSLLATSGGGSAVEVETGEEVLIEGTGFPNGATVFVEYSVDGTPIDDVEVIAEADGTFETTVTPQPGEEGTWTVTATVPKGCLATTGFLVVAGATPTPSPTPTPVASQLPDSAASGDGGGALVTTFVLAAVLLGAILVWAAARARLARSLPS